MVMTMVLLEQYIKSEVENLHLCIDILSEIVEKIDERLARVERQLTLLINAVEDLTVRVSVLEQNMITKTDLDNTLAAFAKQLVRQLSK